MATTTKPAASRAKKPTTARKPATRKPAAKKQEAAFIPEVAADLRVNPSYTWEDKQAMFEAYAALKTAGLKVPRELLIVEDWIAEQTELNKKAVEAREAAESKRAAKLNIEGPSYVRNCYVAPFNLRLDRQTEKRRIELKQRGVPGDLHPLKDEDLNDPILIQNVSLGVIEIISAGEAQIIIEKQTHNAVNRVHTPLAVIQKEYNQMADAGVNVSRDPKFNVAAEFNSQGVTVAYTDPNVLQGKVEDRSIGGFGGLTRPGQKQPPQVHSQFVPTGGNPAIISNGDPAIQNRIRADIAQRGQGVKEQSLRPGPGELKVTVNPTQHT